MAPLLVLLLLPLLLLVLFTVSPSRPTGSRDFYGAPYLWPSDLRDLLGDPYLLKPLFGEYRRLSLEARRFAIRSGVSKPTRSQDGAKTAQNAAKMAQNGAKLEAKTEPRRPKTVVKSKVAFQTLLVSYAGVFRTHFFEFEAVLGPKLAPSWKPKRSQKR